MRRAAPGRAAPLAFIDVSLRCAIGWDAQQPLRSLKASPAPHHEGIRDSRSPRREASIGGVT